MKKRGILDISDLPQPSQPFFGLLNIKKTRISVFLDVEELFVMIDGFALSLQSMSFGA
jgi:hypothetical protein